MKRLMIFAMTMALCLGVFSLTAKADDSGSVIEYALYVAGVRVTSENASDLSVIDGVTGKASYDPDTNTLNLNGATITNTDSTTRCYGIHYVGTKDFTVSSKGKNTISSAGESVESAGGIIVGYPGEFSQTDRKSNLTINIASGSVLMAKAGKALKGGTPKSLGIGYNYEGKITIKGNGTLNVSGGTAYYGYGIHSTGDICISGKVTVNAEANGWYYSVGIHNFDGVYIDGEVNVLAAASDADSGSCGIETEDIYISGGNVTASGGIDPNVPDDSYPDPLSYAGISAVDLEIKGEYTTVSAKGGYASIYCLNKLEISDPLKIIKPKGGVIGSDRHYICEADGKTAALDVLIQDPNPKPTATSTPTPTKASSASLTLDKKTATVVCGKNLTLKATLKNSTSKVSWKSSDTKIATVDGSGKITAKKAGQITITATAAGKSAKCTVTVLYKDVIDSSEFWYAPTNYLTAQNVVKGYANQPEFRPANECTRAQMVTFLYRLQGEPKTKSNTCKFKDVEEKDYFFKPVIWATEKGITTGTSGTTFS
nr:S-layer homology domain-containing protein [Saccharofermentans sp.]